MLLKSNLRLLLAQLNELGETPYFSSELDTLINELQDVLKRLLKKLESTPPAINIDIATYLATHVWKLTQFLTGSTTKQIPYEVVFAIERAASEWTTKKSVITTAIIQEANFFYIGGNPGFFELAKTELGVDIGSQPVQIALPFIYRHKPLFCIPLFHELGHYVDSSNDVIKASMLISPEDVGPDLPGLPTSIEIGKMAVEERELWKQTIQKHRQEYFADLFSAAYMGSAAKGFLQEFCPDEPISTTHPATTSRFSLMDDFVSERSNAILELFQNALTARGLPRLSKRYSAIAVQGTFGNVRPAIPQNDLEVFGLFEAGWQFLCDAWDTPNELWQNLSEDQRERIANDLTEKSIRNRMILDGWNAAIIAS